MINEAIQFLNLKKTQIEKRTLFVLPPHNSIVSLLQIFS